jgi:hypothetical protein
MFLRKHGHDVLTIQETGFTGVKNGEVAELANKEKRTLITRDMHSVIFWNFHQKITMELLCLKSDLITPHWFTTIC